MAQLPDERALGERPTPQATGGIAQYNPAGPSSRGQILSGAGEQIVQAGRIIEETNNQYDQLAAEDAYNQLQTARQDLEIGEETGFKNSQGSNAMGKEFIDSSMQKFANAESQIAAGLKNESSRRMFQQRAQIAKLQHRGAVLSHQAQQTEIFARNVAENTRTTEMRNVASNPENPLMLDAAIARIHASIDGEASRTGMPKEWATTQKVAAIDALNTTRLVAWAERDPVGALAQFQHDRDNLSPEHQRVLGNQLFQASKQVLASQMMNGKLKTTVRSQEEGVALVRLGNNMKTSVSAIVTDLPNETRKDSSNPVFDALTIDQKIEVMNASRILKEQSGAFIRQDLGDRIRDANASYFATGEFPNPPTKDELVASYGADKGARIAHDLAEMQKLGKLKQTVSGMSPEQKAQALHNTEPVPGDGYANAQDRFEALAKVIEASNREIEKDPSGYVLAHAPVVQAAYTELGTALSNPSAKPVEVAAMSEKYAQASYAEQRRLGVADPNILPKSMAENVVSMFNRETSNGDNMATRIDAAAQQWGKYWPDVYRQLAVNFKGNLPDSFLTIPGLTSGAAKEEVARLDHIKMEDLKKQLPQSDVKSIGESVQEALRPWSESMLSNQTNSNLYQSVNSAAMKMAMVRVQRGQSVGAAVEAATSSFIGNLEFSDVSSVSKYSIPKDEDAGAVTAGVRGVMAAIPSINIGTPPYGDLTGMRKPAELAAEWKEIVTNNPMWVTSSDQSGLKLYAIGKDGRQYPVNTPSGEQIQYSWADLRDMGTSAVETQKARSAITSFEGRTQENMAKASLESARNRIMISPMTPAQKQEALRKLETKGGE